MRSRILLIDWFHFSSTEFSFCGGLKSELYKACTYGHRSMWQVTSFLFIISHSCSYASSWGTEMRLPILGMDSLS